MMIFDITSGWTDIRDSSHWRRSWRSTGEFLSCFLFIIQLLGKYNLLLKIINSVITKLDLLLIWKLKSSFSKKTKKHGLKTLWFARYGFKNNLFPPFNYDPLPPNPHPHSGLSASNHPLTKVLPSPLTTFGPTTDQPSQFDYRTFL